MTEYTVDELIAAWTRPLDERRAQDPVAYQESMRLTDLTLQLLAQGQPVSTMCFAQAAGGPLSEVQEFFIEYQESGGEFDDQGRLAAG